MAGAPLPHTGAFSLADAASFGFGPSQHAPGAAEPHMELAFVTDDLAGHAAAELTQSPDGTVTAALHGDGDEAAVLRQVVRVLSLDHDGDAWAAVVAGDPVLAGVVAARPGMRPVLFHSPYEAAAWSILSARRPAAQASATRDRIAADLGATFALGGRELHAFPTPAALRDVRPGPVLPERKVGWLHALADFAMAGELDQADLLAMDPDAAREHVQQLAGIGPFYALLVIVRGTGHADVVADEEPVTQGSVGHFYGLGAVATPAQVRERSERWRPFRTWASVHLHVAGREAGLGPARYRNR